MKEPIYSREIAGHLYRLANLLESESLRLDAIRIEHTLTMNEIGEIREIANRLYEAKCKIDA